MYENSASKVPSSCESRPVARLSRYSTGKAGTLWTINNLIVSSLPLPVAKRCQCWPMRRAHTVSTSSVQPVV